MPDKTIDSVRTYSDIRLDVSDAVATITINRPQRMNAFTGETLAQLADALDRTANASSVGVVVLTGAGDRAFCAGRDILWEHTGGLEGLDFQLGAKIVDHPKPI